MTAINVNGTLSYLVSDTLGSVSVALSSSGSVQADQLFTPYGATRYASGTTTASYGYDGSGNRVEQVATSGSTTTATVYVGGDEEVSTSGSTTTTTTYYAAGPVTATM